MTARLVLPLLLPLMVMAGPPPFVATAAAAQEDAAELFQKNCAACHGESGDGNGWTQLDRRARSFRDGGFSYGNTPEAILRTITNGIPGTPMPAFDSSLTLEQRESLAAYVRSLGPPVEEVSTEETVLVVGARPAVVRGLLPPIAAGAEEHARGLLIGTPDGLTFEYRTDDVRLLGVRQGGFVQRTDWIGRGGTPLAPLGRVFHLFEGGVPRALFRREGAELVGRLAGTWIRGTTAGLDYELRTADGARVARVRESCHARGTLVAAGFVRGLALSSAAEVSLELRLRPFAPGDALVDTFVTADRSSTTWYVVRRADGVHELLGARLPGALAVSWPDEHGLAGRITLPPGESVTAELTTLLALDWTDELRTQLLEELSR